LLEHADLPDEIGAARIAARFDPLPDAGIQEAALSAARAVHELPEAPTLFGPSSRGEVPLRGTLIDSTGAKRAVSGSIDRLVILPEEIWVIDFKTTTSAPDPARLADDMPDYVAQLALYQALLAAKMPDRPVCCGLVWTAKPRLDWLPESALAEARQALGLALPS
ncbi:MAG: PD-(D/E)XK nuclease family protein, partial [Cohaesibacteraceae bacterium]